MCTKQGTQKVSLMSESKMTAKCKKFINYTENFIGSCKTKTKQIWLPNKESISSQRCERKYMAYKGKVSLNK